MRIIYSKDPNFEPIKIDDWGGKYNNHYYDVNNPKLSEILIAICRQHNMRKKNLEPFILKSGPMACYQYMFYVVKRGVRLKEFESVISKDPWISYLYAANVLQKRWPEGESSIISDNNAVILNSAFLYVKNIIKGRWPKLEEHLIQNNNIPGIVKYAKHIINGRWPEVEHLIMPCAHFACEYVVNVIRGPWPEAEKYIKMNKKSWTKYMGYIGNKGL